MNKPSPESTYLFVNTKTGKQKFFDNAHDLSIDSWAKDARDYQIYMRVNPAEKVHEVTALRKFLENARTILVSLW
jgi:hypothetical protein